MKLASFQVRTPVGLFTRVGALHGNYLVDVNMAYTRWLADEREAQPYRLAGAQVPSAMRKFLEGGPSAMEAARRALERAVVLGVGAEGPAGETIFYETVKVRVIAPLPNPASLRDFIAWLK